MEGQSSAESSARSTSEFSDWVCVNGGSDEIVRILSDHGFSSKLSLRHLDLKSSDAKALVDKLNYGQKCFVQGLVSLVPRPRPAFRRLQYGKAWTVLIATESWAGPGNEAKAWSSCVLKPRRMQSPILTALALVKPIHLEAKLKVVH